MADRRARWLQEKQSSLPPTMWRSEWQESE